MSADLDIVRHNVRYYKDLLQQGRHTVEQRQQILAQLDRARTELRRALAQDAARTSPSAG
ncbi:MAG: hypothetical protein ACRED7_07550 [Stellaceae bacterium]